MFQIDRVYGVRSLANLLAYILVVGTGRPWTLSPRSYIATQAYSTTQNAPASCVTSRGSRVAPLFATMRSAQQRGVSRAIYVRLEKQQQLKLQCTEVASWAETKGFVILPSGTGPLYTQPTSQKRCPVVGTWSIPAILQGTITYKMPALFASRLPDQCQSIRNAFQSVYRKETGKTGYRDPVCLSADSLVRNELAWFRYFSCFFKLGYALGGEPPEPREPCSSVPVLGCSSACLLPPKRCGGCCVDHVLRSGKQGKVR